MDAHEPAPRHVTTRCRHRRSTRTELVAVVHPDDVAAFGSWDWSTDLIETPAYQQAVEDTAAALDRQGHDVHIVFPDPFEYVPWCAAHSRNPDDSRSLTAWQTATVHEIPIRWPWEGELAAPISAMAIARATAAHLTLASGPSAVLGALDEARSFITERILPQLDHHVDGTVELEWVADPNPLAAPPIPARLVGPGRWGFAVHYAAGFASEPTAIVQAGLAAALLLQGTVAVDLSGPRSEHRGIGAAFVELA